MYSSSLSSRKREEVSRSRNAFCRVDICDSLGKQICNLELVGVGVVLMLLLLLLLLVVGLVDWLFLLLLLLGVILS